jgi:hypothetical protein
MVGIDYARSGVFALALEQARIEVDLRFTSSESGDQMLQGDIAVDLEPIGVYAAERIQIAATGACDRHASRLAGASPAMAPGAGNM